MEPPFFSWENLKHIYTSITSGTYLSSLPPSHNQYCKQSLLVIKFDYEKLRSHDIELQEAFRRQFLFLEQDHHPLYAICKTGSPLVFLVKLIGFTSVPIPCGTTYLCGKKQSAPKLHHAKIEDVSTMFGDATYTWDDTGMISLTTESQSLNLTALKLPVTSAVAATSEALFQECEELIPLLPTLPQEKNVHLHEAITKFNWADEAEAQENRARLELGHSEEIVSVDLNLTHMSTTTPVQGIGTEATPGTTSQMDTTTPEYDYGLEPFAPTELQMTRGGYQPRGSTRGGRHHQRGHQYARGRERICKDYKAHGFCLFGSLCKFEHDKSQAMTPLEIRNTFDHLSAGVQQTMAQFRALHENINELRADIEKQIGALRADLKSVGVTESNLKKLQGYRVKKPAFGSDEQLKLRAHDFFPLAKGSKPYKHGGL